MARGKLYDLYSPKGERIFKNAKADILASYLDVDRRKVVIYARSEKPGRATQCILDCFNRLAEYEDIGLSPEQLSKIVERTEDDRK